MQESIKLNPFREVIKIVQEKRREYPKGIISNSMYKEIGNSIYGSVVRGISNKRKFDIKTKDYKKLEGDDLSNPSLLLELQRLLGVFSVNVCIFCKTSVEKLFQLQPMDLLLISIVWRKG